MGSTKRKPASSSGSSSKVTLVPVAGAFIPGVPAVEQIVSATRAKELLAYHPPAFAVKEAKKAAAPKATAKPAPAPEPPPVNEGTEAPAAGEES